PLREWFSRPRLWIELVMAALAITTIWISISPDTAVLRALSWTIWGIFLLEYFTRFAVARERWNFIRSNLPDLVAIIPFDLLRAFRLIRLLRVLQLLRGLAVLRRVGVHVAGILRTNGLGYVLVSTLAMVIGAGLLISKLEPEIALLSDGIWWSVVTATTVGYGDISPKTLEGRLVAGVLMLIGIGMIAMVTGSIATYFIGTHGAHNPHVRHIQKQLDGWHGMSAAERRDAVAMLRALADQGEAETLAEEDARYKK
ncbi:MAG: ion transporter, partial [Candidatus Eisenbacteria bacterium]